MAIFRTRITHVTLTLSPFSSEQMAEIGNIFTSSVLDRWRQGITADDVAASPLSNKSRRAFSAKTGQMETIGGYRDRKSGPGVYLGLAGPYRGSNFRDWFLRGVTSRSLKVKSANQNGFTAGFTTPQANNIVSAINRIPGGRMWGASGKDMEKIYAQIRYLFQTGNMIKVQKSQVA